MNSGQRRKQIPRSLLARTFPIPTLRFRMGPRVNARSLRSVGMTESIGMVVHLIAACRVEPHDSNAPSISGGGHAYADQDLAGHRLSIQLRRQKLPLLQGANRGL